jgi:predicted amidohydrolase YtcJ
MTDWRVAEKEYNDPDSIAYPYRSLLDAGATLCIGSDAPVMAGDRPGDAAYAAVERRDETGLPPGGWTPEERISMEEVLEAFSRGAAYAEGAENRRGRIAEGFDADLTLLAEDIRGLRGEAIRSWPVIGTIVAGRARIFR